MTPSEEPTGAPAPPRGSERAGTRGHGTGRHTRLGRRVALAVYAVAVTYVVVASFLSIPAQIFSPARAASSAPCPSRLQTLEAELLDAAHEAVDPRAGGRPPDPAFWRDWDARLAGARADCPSLQAPLDDLHQVRYRIEGSLEHHERTAGALARRLHGTLAPADDGPAGDAAPTRP